MIRREVKGLSELLLLLGHFSDILNLAGPEGWLSEGSLIFYLAFLVEAPAFDAREAQQYWNNRLGIFRATGRGLLDHPYAERHHPSAPPMGGASGGQLKDCLHQMISCVQCILFPCCCIGCHSIWLIIYIPWICLLYTSPSPRDRQKSRMPSSA